MSLTMSFRRYCLAFSLLLLGSAGQSQNAEPVRLVGVGSTIPLRSYAKWLQEFGRRDKKVQALYLPYGSAQAVEMVAAGNADFGASDAPLATSPQAKTIRFFPVAVGALVPIYNLAGLSHSLRFTPQALAGIYLGEITRWNDRAIAGPNPEVRLPAREIVVIHSAPGRGSSYVWSDFLSKVSHQWQVKVGRGASLRWPTGIEADGSGNVAKAVKETPNSIGYVELGYAVEMELQQGLVENAAGRFVSARPESIATAASTCVISPTDDFRCSITNPDGAGSYPIATFTWFLVPANASSSPARQRATKDLLRWILTEGQNSSFLLGLAKVPESLVERELNAIDRTP